MASRISAAALLWQFILYAAISAVASAAQVKLVVEASVEATGVELQRHEQFITVNDVGSFSVVQLVHGNDTWQFYEGYVSGQTSEPSLSVGYGLQNTKSFPVAFQVTLELPVNPIPSNTRVGGRTVGLFGATSTLEGGTIFNFGPNPFFAGLLDSSPVIELLSGPFSLASAPGEFGSIPTTSLGLPSPSLPGTPVTQSISVRNSFVLSGGSSMSVGNDFIVRAVPEPSTLRSFAMGTVCVASAMSRRLRF
jgi:hypothetical protein